MPLALGDPSRNRWAEPTKTGLGFQNEGFHKWWYLKMDGL